MKGIRGYQRSINKRRKTAVVCDREGFWFKVSNLIEFAKDNGWDAQTVYYAARNGKPLPNYWAIRYAEPAETAGLTDWKDL